MTTWTTPRTWQVGETATAALLNTHLRDNQLNLYESLLEQAFDFPMTQDARFAMSAVAVQSANNCYYVRVFGTGVITKIRVIVGTSNGNIGVAAYDNSGTGVSAVPNSRQATSGSVACPAAGAADVSIGATVTVGLLGHWFALSASGVTATFVPTGQSMSSDWLTGTTLCQGSAHPPPATASGSAIATIPFYMAGVP